MAADEPRAGLGEPDSEPDAVGSEKTRVTPEELIETLREASRVDETLSESSIGLIDGMGTVVGPASQVRDEDQTLVFVLHETPDPPSPWLRRDGVLAGAAVMLSLFALPAGPRASDRPASALSGVPATQAALKVRVRVAPRVERPSPQPIIEQLVSSASIGVPAADLGEPPLEEDEQVSESDADNEAQGRNSRRRWLRAFDRGQRRLAAADYDGAAFSFERAIEYNPRDSRAHAALGEAQLGRGKWGEAVRAFRKAVALSPYEATLRAGLARAYELGGKPRMAAKAHRRAAKLELRLSEVEHSPGVSTD